MERGVMRTIGTLRNTVEHRTARVAHFREHSTECGIMLGEVVRETTGHAPLDGADFSCDDSL